MADVTVIDAGGIIAAHRRWFIFLGLALIVAGVLAIVFPFAGGLAVEVWVAVAMILTGVAQCVHAFGVRQWQGFLLSLLIGLLYLAAGIMLWLNPVKGVVTLTALLAAVMVVDGILSAVMAFKLRPLGGWAWMLISGVIGVVAGVMVWQQLPSSAFWAIGLLLGINLIFSGAAFTMLAKAARPSV